MDRQTFEAELKRDGYDDPHQHHAGRQSESRAQPSLRRAGDGDRRRADARAGTAPSRTFRRRRDLHHAAARLPALLETLRARRRGDPVRPEDELSGDARTAANHAHARCAQRFVLIALLALCGLIAWLQNVHIITANGMYKSIQAEPWIADPSTRAARSVELPVLPALRRALPAARSARASTARRAVAAVRLSQCLLGEPRHRRSSMPSSIA